MKKTILYIFLAIVSVLFSNTIFAQAPNISYATSQPAPYPIGTAITSLTPTNTGGATTSGFYSFTTFITLTNPAYGVATDAFSNVYTVDYHGGTGGILYKYNSSGVGGAVTITGATLAGPTLLTIDGLNNIYVTDYTNKTVYKINSSGTVLATITGFTYAPYGVVTDASNNVYIVDVNDGNLGLGAAGPGIIRKVAAGATGSVTATTFLSGLTGEPYGIAVVGNDFYVSLLLSNTVVKYVNGVTGGTTQTAFASGFNAPRNIGNDASGNIYVADYGNNRVQVIPPAGGTGSTVISSLTSPRDITFDVSGNLYIGNGTSNDIIRSIPGNYSISPVLPTGLSFNSTTGVISGTPTAITASAVYSISGGNTSGISTTTVTLSTIDAAPSLSYSPTTYTLGINNVMTPLAPTNSGGAVPATTYGTVSTFAGAGGAGTTDGAAATAKFSAPTGITVDNSANVFVADKTNNRIRQITSGTVSTLAGATAGRTNGTGTAALFTTPTDITADLSGNLYVADFGNNEVRQIVSSSAAVTLLAGSATGASGSTNSPALFKSPSGAAYDATTGAVYIADQANALIRKVIVSSGATSTFGSGVTYTTPTNVAVDASGNVYVTDKGLNKIIKITAAGAASIFAGSGTAASTDGTGTGASFNAPDGITIDKSGNIYVSDGAGNKIRMITPAGVVTTVAGAGGAGNTNGVGTAAKFSAPAGLDIDPTSGNIIVADVTNNLIRQIIGTGYTISPTTLPTGLSFDGTTGTISGTPTANSGPTAYTITGFNAAGSSSATVTLTVALVAPAISYTTPDSYILNSAITSPTLSNTAGAVGSFGYGTGIALTGATLSAPYNMATDNFGNIYVANSGNGTISKYLSTGVYSGVFASGLTNPVAIVFDASNNCFILGEAATSKVYKYNSSGTQLSSNYITGLNASWGMAIDASNNLYFTNINGTTYSVKKYNSAGTVQTSPITATNLNLPTGITIDPAGNFYVLNGLGNGKVYKFPSTGGAGAQFTGTTFGATSYAITTDPVGNVYVGNSAAGSVSVYTSGATLLGSKTGLTTPRGITVDTLGNLYVASNGGTVTKYPPTGGYFLTSPLPTGLALNSSTGAITGTPTATTPATDYTVTAWNTAGSGSTDINITCYSQFTWVGSVTGGLWNNPTNWGGTVPSSADQAVIGATGTFTNPPVINATTGPVSVGSIVIGTKTASPSITVTGTTLTVSGDITFESNNTGTTTTSTTASLTGTGSISANNLNITTATGTSTRSYSETLTSNLTGTGGLTLGGTINLISKNTGGGANLQNSKFSLTGGSLTTDGIVTTNAVAGNNPVVTISTGTTLQFTGAAAFSGLSSTGTNTITGLSGTGVTIGYTGNNAQTVYTDAAIANSSLTTGITYTNLAFSGTTSIKTALSGNVNVTGNFTNSMVSDTTSNYVDFSSPTVNFTGTAQALAGGTGVGTTFYNVTMSGVGTKTMSGLFNIASTGNLTMTGTSSTILNAGSSVLTLNSDASGSASIAALNGPVINGTVNVQRFITGGSGKRGYRLLSSPVYASAVSSNNVYSINYIANSCYITGTTVTTTGPGIDKAGNPTLYLFRENITPSQASFTGGNFRGVGNMGSTGSTSYINYTMDIDGGPYNIPVGNGFLFFFRGDRSAGTIAAETVTTYVPTNTTLTATGTLNQGNITAHDWFNPSSANLSYTTVSSPSPGNSTIRGYNLIGNPYPSSISWTSLYANNNYNINNNVGVSIYEFNPFTNQYGAYVEGAVTGTGGFGDVIASGQGFFVVASNASATLNFTEACKVSTQPSTLLLNALPGATVPQYMHLKMIKDSVNYDDVIIAFKGGTNTKYSMHEDALHLTGNSPPETLTTLSSDSVNLSVNYLPLPTQKVQTISLSVDATASGTFSLAKTELTGIPAFYEIWLKDNLMKDSLDLRANSNYNFTIDKTNPATFGAKRFQILIRENPALALQLINFSAVKVAGTAQAKVNWVVQNEASYTMFYVQRSNDNGKTFQTIDSLQSTGIGSYSFIDNSPAKGENQYRLQLKDVNGTVTYSTIVIVQFPDNSSNVLISNISIYPNPASDILNVTVLGNNAATASYSMSIINSDGGIVKKETESQSSWQSRISDLAPGVYILRVVNTTNQQIVGTNKFIKL
ncbi:MAG: putative Ig domain-containing protein [Mucilaginibacter sp.]